MEESRPDLKPCPFCRSVPYCKSCDRLIQIGCESCGYHRHWDGIVTTEAGHPEIPKPQGSIPEFYNCNAQEEADEAWNARPDDADKGRVLTGSTGPPRRAAPDS